MGWAAPIQMTICLVLLLVNLGPSALAGFALLIMATPIQTLVMKRLMGLRKKSMVFTDKRAKLLQELLGNMRIIKLFSWEVRQFSSEWSCISPVYVYASPLFSRKSRKLEARKLREPTW